MIEKILIEIKNFLKEMSPNLTEEQNSRMYKIINPDISNYIVYGIKTKDIEDIVRAVYNSNIKCTYEEAIEIFKLLAKSNIEEEKFAAFLFLNRFKKHFNVKTLELFKEEFLTYCYTWSVCDSTCIRVLGPFLGKKGNETLARQIIADWSKSDNLWIKRASMVILLKIIMQNKNFEEVYVFKIVEEMLKYAAQNYIEKGIGWLLKTCSKYKPEVIYHYLIKNKKHLTRLILRYASEKLSEEKRRLVLKK